MTFRFGTRYAISRSVAMIELTGAESVSVANKRLICTSLGHFDGVFACVAMIGLKVPVFSTKGPRGGFAVRIGVSVNTDKYGTRVTNCQGKNGGTVQIGKSRGKARGELCGGGGQVQIRLAFEVDFENPGVDCWNEMPTMQGRVPEWIYGL